LFLGGDDDAKERGELRFKLALRAAFFITATSYTRRQIFRHMRAAYDVRSAIAHGAGAPDPRLLRAPNGERVPLHEFARITTDLLRIALKRGIDVAQGSHGALIDWDALILGNGDALPAPPAE